MGKRTGLFDNPQRRARLVKVAEFLLVSPMRVCLGLAVIDDRFDPATVKRLARIVDSPREQRRDPMRAWFGEQRASWPTRELSLAEADALRKVVRSCPRCLRHLLDVEFDDGLTVCLPCFVESIHGAREALAPKSGDGFVRVVRAPGRVKLRG